MYKKRIRTNGLILFGASLFLHAIFVYISWALFAVSISFGFENGFSSETLTQYDSR